MNKLIVLLLPLLFILNQCGLMEYKSFRVQLEDVEQISFQQGFDSTPVLLNKEKSEQLIKLLNDNKNNGPTKFGKTYIIEIKLKNDSTINLLANDAVFSVKNDFAYQLNSTNGLNVFWKSINKKE